MSPKPFPPKSLVDANTGVAYTLIGVPDPDIPGLAYAVRVEGHKPLTEAQLAKHTATAAKAIKKYKPVTIS